VDSVATKRCVRCDIDKPRDQVKPFPKYRDGLWSYCRECGRELGREQYAKDRSKRKLEMRAAYLRDADAYKARALRRYREKRNLVLLQVAEWAAANRELTRTYKRKWARENPDSVREKVRRRAAQKAAVLHIPFTTEQLAAKVAYWGDRCWICGGANEAIDHVKPLAKGGAHALANLRPICTACNTRKKDRWPWPPIG